MLPGVAGAGVTVTAIAVGVLVPQLLSAVTLMLPDTLPKFTEMDVVPCPATMVLPEGTVQV